jgi:putative heme-binding domain-containing protein
LFNAVAALARQGEESHQPRALKAMASIDVNQLTKTQKLELLRAYSLLFTRLGHPGQSRAAVLSSRLDTLYPADDSELNRELARVLVYLNSATVIEKTLALMEEAQSNSDREMGELLARNSGYGGKIAQMLANHPVLDRVHYALVLRNMKYGWTLPQRQRYFEQLASLRTKTGGASYQGFIDNIRKEALENASPAERAALEGKIAPPPKPTELPKPIGPGQQWAVADVEALASKGLEGRNFEAGRRAFAATRCVLCHRFAGEGGATGPDLTNAAGRFSHKDLVEALVEPSKVISDQYKASTIITTGGKVISGRITAENDGNLTVLTDPEDASKISEIPAAEIDQVADSKTSLMPAKLLDVLSEEEVLDLMAYLLSRGNPDDRMFAPAGE